MPEYLTKFFDRYLLGAYFFTDELVVAYLGKRIALQFPLELRVILFARTP